MRGGRIALAAVIAAGLLGGPSVAHAAAPPNPHDPCVQAGRDSCGTAGVGFYRTSRYGLRWFGDYRGALAGGTPTFCLDLGYWYASRGYRYRPSAARLRTRGGETVPLEARRRLAYAVWRYGRSGRPSQQAAVMLYVHSLMGDARPGEIDPAALGRRVSALYRRIVRDSARLHGPYRIEATLPKRLLVGRPATATIRVLSAAGIPVPTVTLGLGVTGADGAPRQLQTNAAGTARVRLTPIATGGIRLRLTADELAAPQPHVFAPTAGASRANGQRLVAPAAERVVGTSSRTDVGASPKLVTHVTAQTAAPGSSISDIVTVTGLGGSSAVVHVELYGPFASRSAIRCSGTPAWTGSFTAAGDGRTTTTPVRLDRAGYYAYRESIAPSPPSEGFDTPCPEAAETTVVRARPSLDTLAPEQIVRAGSPVTDRVRVQGLGKTPASMEVELFGPFPSRAAVRCTYADLRWHRRIAVPGDTALRTPAVPLARVGFYAVRERLIGTPLVAGTTTDCASPARTLLAAPRIVTGRGDVAKAVRAPDAAGSTPVRLRIASLGIDAAIAPAGIDLRHGVLGIPTDIDRLGWWRDGRAPGARTGAVLVAGHVDSATSGEGALFALAKARAGELVELKTAAGRSYSYRVASVHSYPKALLPTSVYSRLGAARLVLVTCGGRFDEATGHYPDDVVVTATPAAD